MQFQTEVNELLQLMIHSLYSNKEIFLRELISNASDACDKRSLARASGDDSSDDELVIKISADEQSQLLIIEDSGCGMSKDELINNLGTIAHSGTKEYLKEQKPNAAELIGQFGVGFYSAFMVADKIEVFSKSFKDPSAHCWSSDASGYEISECQKDKVGTKIVLHLKDKEFASELRIEHLIKKYSKHINYKILLEKIQTEASGDTAGAKVFEQINAATALWKENKTNLKDSDYIEFYKEMSYSQEPLTWLHVNSEGSLEFNALLYVPTTAPHDMMQMDYERNCKLYVKRVLISEKEDLLPVWLRFIKGVIDVADLDLNVSREILQDNAKLLKISSLCSKKLLGAVAKLSPEKLKSFNETFGAVIKEGLLDPKAPVDEIYKILSFKSSKGELSLDEYIEKYAKDSKEIYYLQGDNLSMLEKNALVNNYECVIFLSDKIDEFLSASLPAYKEHKWFNISEAKIQASVDNSEQEELAKAIKTALSEKVKEVKFSANLGDCPAAIVYDGEDQNYQLSKMMAKFSNQDVKFQGDLILNSEHELIKKALANKDEAKNAKLGDLLFALASLSTNSSLENLQNLADAATYFALNSYEA